MSDEIDHEYTDFVVCPWCGHVHLDSQEFDDGSNTCHECDKEFSLRIDQTVTYTTTKEWCS